MNNIETNGQSVPGMNVDDIDASSSSSDDEEMDDEHSEAILRIEQLQSKVYNSYLLVAGV